MATEVPSFLASPEDLQTYLVGLPPVDRVRIAAFLANAQLRAWLVRIADAATAELASGSTYAETARLLGVSSGMVNRRMTRHHKRQDLLT
jgi:hypothetical protein